MSASEQQRQLGRSSSSMARDSAKENAKAALATSTLDGTLPNAMAAASDKEAATGQLATADVDGTLPRAMAVESDKEVAKAGLAQATVDGTLPRALGETMADVTLTRSQSSPSRPKTQKQLHEEHHKDYTNRLRKQISEGLKCSMGASFEERSAAGAARMKKKANTIETRQARMLEEAVARAKTRPIESPVRPKHLEPESVEARVARGKAVLRQREREYAEEKDDLLYRMKTREPLFKVSEVEAAKEEQRQRQAAYRQEMKEDEERRWEYIRSLKEKVLKRPMVVDDYRKPVHATPDQLPPHMGEETELDRKIKRGMAKKSYSESSWAQTIQEIHQRADNRVPLSKIPYPPKKFPEYQPRPKVLSSMDQRLVDLVNEPTFKNSEWARTVGDIQQRQTDRTPLHLMEYPSKV